MANPEPDPPVWERVGDYGDIRYELAEGIAKITICRPEVRNAFRPETLGELADAFNEARDDPAVGVVILTGEGEQAFCSGGDQRIRGEDGYIGGDAVGRRGIGRLNVLDLQIQIRRLPKPVVAMVAGYAIGGGQVLQLVCDLSIAADNARFGQTGPRVGSFDAGFGAGLLARTIGMKRAKEVWFLCRQYDAEQALAMGLVNAVVPLARLEAETVGWCREMLALSPIALRMLKAGFNAVDDGLAGVQQLAGDATMLFYMSEEAQEGRDAFLERRAPDFSRFPPPSLMAARDWVAAARPRTLPAALSPVAVGIGVARAAGPVSSWRAVLCFVVALAIQIGTNYANDYSDGVRGTDERRVGPTRLVASGLASPAAVRGAAFASFGVGAAAGAVLALSTSPWLLFAGAASIAAGWYYTGGRHPYGYAGLGEGFVFVFFGIVAVTGTVYVCCRHLPALAFVAAVPVGFLTVALLVVNNLRDIPNDALSGKRTLAVRIGAPRTRALYTALLLAAFALLAAVAPFRPAGLVALGASVLAIAPLRRVLGRAEGPDLIRALAMTGTLQLAFGGLLAVGIAL